MTIQELKPSKRVAGRWLAVLEDGSILRMGESEIADFALYPGRELAEEETERLLTAVRRRGFRERALELASRKPQSRRELERELERWGAEEEETAAVCDRLEELGYLNDSSYAALVVRHYTEKGFGERRLRDELYRRGIPRELWDEALGEAGDSGAAIDAFVRKKLAGRVPDRKLLKQISDALARRGYAWSEIGDALRRCGAETGED